MDTDCPGGDSTVCQPYDGFSACVNYDHATVGLCHRSYVCGYVPTPAPNAPVAPEADPESVVEGPVVGDGSLVLPEEREDLSMAAGVQFHGGGCSAADQGPVGGLGFAAFLALGLLRRRRDR